MHRLLIFFLILIPNIYFAQDIIINEIMASNKTTILDEDGETPDWIELLNSGNQTVDLNGFSLSDNILEVQKWQFGEVSIDPGEHLLVFASDKDKSNLLSHWETIIKEGDSWKYKIGNSAIPKTWINPDYDDNSWASGPSGFGYSDGDDNTNLQAQSPIISIFIRKKFNVSDISSILSAVLHVDYDDGFVAYINGVEVARANLGVEDIQPEWNDLASVSEAVLYSGGTPDKFNIDQFEDILIEGENTVAVEVHNTSTTSSDLSIIPFLSLGMNMVPDGALGSPGVLGLEISQSYLHTNFRISASGERIILSGSDGTILNQVEVPASSNDISYGRISDASSQWIFQLPTPGEANSGVEYFGYADTVEVSVSGGFYPSPIAVGLTAGESRIYYTLDGSDPDSTSTFYTSPIAITKTSVLKTFGMRDNYLASPVIIQTYFINESTDLPVISLSTDPYNLFDYNYGIYADGPGWTPENPHFGANYWMDWERPAYIEFFDDDKNFGFAENCAIEIFGGWTRAFPQKSFSVKFKNTYNASRIDYRLFPEIDVSSFKSITLRNSGNDFEFTHLRDAVMQELVKDLDIDYLEYRPAAAFINGEYWGIYNIREKISEHYIADRHDVDPDNIDLLEGDRVVIHGDAENYQQLVDFISSQNMATDEAYNYINNKIDLDECLLYYASQIYFNNYDWPGNNIKYWRERTPTAKWRWILYDTDFGFNLYEDNGQAENLLEFALSPVQNNYANPNWATLLPRKLVENPKIKNKFVNVLADLLNTNFKSSRVVSIMYLKADHISNEIARHRSRFGINGENLVRMHNFALERPDYLRGFVRDYFNAGSDCSVTINNTTGGTIKLNSLYLEENDLPWSGVYFENNALQIKAIPSEGYKFDGWSGSVSSQDASISISGIRTVTLTASFSTDNSVAKNIVINEINYNSSDVFDSGDWIELFNRTGENIDLSGWIFKDKNADNQYEIPFGTSIPSNGYLVIVQDDSAFSAAFPEVNNYIGEINFGLSGSGEFIQLEDSDGQIIDSLTFDDELPWPVEAAGLGSTLELFASNEDNSLAENWRASDGNGSPGAINTVISSADEITSVQIPTKYSLDQNYPNPFNPETIIGFSIPQKSDVSLKIYDVLGEEVRILTEGERSAGNYSIKFNFSSLPSGVYFYRLKSGSFTETKKMILMK